MSRILSWIMILVGAYRILIFLFILFAKTRDFAAQDFWILFGALIWIVISFKMSKLQQVHPALFIILIVLSGVLFWLG